MPVSVVNDDGSWSASPDDEFKFKFTNQNGDSIFDVKRKDDGTYEGNVNLGGVDIGTKENKITLGGASQELKVDGKLRYGKTTVGVLGGSFDLGDGATEKFQFSFTAEITPAGIRWTGVATNDLTETHKLEMPKASPSKLSRKSEVSPLEIKDPEFDEAGILEPRKVFKKWAKYVKLNVEMEASLEKDKKEATMTVTRSLKVELRPVFEEKQKDEPYYPFPPPARKDYFDKSPGRVQIPKKGSNPGENEGPAQPPAQAGPGPTQPPGGNGPGPGPPPGGNFPILEGPIQIIGPEPYALPPRDHHWISAPPEIEDALEKLIHELMQKQIELQIIGQFVAESVAEVDKWMHIHKLKAIVTLAGIAVVGAVAAVTAAGVAAGCFLGANLVFDWAEGGAVMFYSAKAAELAAAELTYTTALSGLAWGTAAIGSAVISEKALSAISSLSQAAAGGDVVAAGQIEAGAQMYFGKLSQEYGLAAAGEDHEKMADSLKRMHVDITADLERTSAELHKAAAKHKAMRNV